MSLLMLSLKELRSFLCTRLFQQSAIELYMPSEQLVVEIVETYDGLSPRLRDRIARIAISRAGEIGLDYNGVYGLVADLVDAFTTPFQERYALRLDRQIGDSKRFFHEFIGTEDADLTRLFEDEVYEDKRNLIPAHYAFDILGNHLDERHSRLLLQLLQSSGNENPMLNISPQELLIEIPQIKEKLEELSRRYERKGRLTIPKRPVVSIRIHPKLDIRFGNRRYSDPLSFYFQHRETYQGLGRTGLKKFDRGLHAALGRSGQLDRAIPETIHSWNKLTEEQIDEIVAAYEVYGGNGWDASKHLPYSPPTIRKYWKARGLKPNPRSPPYSLDNRLTQEQIDEIVAAYKVYGGVSQRAARYLPYSHLTIIKYWRCAGLEIMPRGRMRTRTVK